MAAPLLARRLWLRSLSGAAGALVGASALAACARRAPAPAAQPTPASPSITLNFAPNWQGATWNATAQSLNQQWFDANWKVPGVRVNVAGHVQSQAVAQVAASIAGTGFMDVFQDCCDSLVTWVGSGFLLPLGDRMRQDNVDASLWSARHMQVLNFDGQQLALPAYDGPCTVFYRQDILDDLGLAYPDSTWTLADLQRLAAGTTGKNADGQSRTGLNLVNTNWYAQIAWLLTAWGAQEMSADRTVCMMGSPQAVQMAAFLQDGVRGQWLGAGGGPAQLANGSVVFHICGGWQLFAAATSLGGGVKWDILPVPNWPAGRATFNNIDFYAVNAATKHPDEAWELLKFVTAEPNYQRWQIKTTLVQPSLNSLWDEWETDVVTVAPPLRNKQVHWIRDAAVGGYAWPTLFFKYNGAQADDLINSWVTQVWSGRVTPTLGMQQLTQQINALQQAGSGEAASAARVAAAFPTDGPAIAALPAGI